MSGREKKLKSVKINGETFLVPENSDSEESKPQKPSKKPSVASSSKTKPPQSESESSPSESKPVKKPSAASASKTKPLPSESESSSNDSTSDSKSNKTKPSKPTKKPSAASSSKTKPLPSESESSSDDSESNKTKPSKPTKKPSAASSSKTKKKPRGQSSEDESSSEDSSSGSEDSSSGSDDSSSGSDGSEKPSAKNKKVKFQKYEEFGGVQVRAKLMEHQLKLLRFAIERQEIPHVSLKRTNSRGIVVDDSDLETIEDFTMKGSLIGADPGLGKTLTSLILMKHNLKKFKDGSPCLVVSEKNIILSVWEKEIVKFFGKKIKFYIYHREANSGYEKMTISKLKKYDIILTTKEVLRAAAEDVYGNKFDGGIVYHEVNGSEAVDKYLHPEKVKENKKTGKQVIMRMKWNTVIIDEVHGAVNRTTQYFKSLMCLSSRFFHGLSGTLVKNYASEDLYSELCLIGLSVHIGKENPFDRFYRTTNISDWIYIMSKEDSGVTLTEVKTIQDVVPLGERHRQVYDFLLTKLNNAVVIHQQNRDDGSYGTILGIFQRLRQCCIAPYLITRECAQAYEQDYNDNLGIMNGMDEKLERWCRNESSKKESPLASAPIMKAIERILENREKIIVFSDSVLALMVLEESMKDFCKSKKIKAPKMEKLIGGTKKDDRDSSMKKFLQGNSQVMLATFKTGSQGLNMQQASRVLFLEQWWSPAIHEQALSRTNRIGQTRDVTKYDIIPENTIQYRILRICMEKLSEKEKFLAGKSTGKKSDNGGLNLDIILQILGQDETIHTGKKKGSNTRASSSRRDTEESEARPTTNSRTVESSDSNSPPRRRTETSSNSKRKK